MTDYQIHVLVLLRKYLSIGKFTILFLNSSKRFFAFPTRSQTLLVIWIETDLSLITNKVNSPIERVYQHIENVLRLNILGKLKELLLVNVPLVQVTLICVTNDFKKWLLKYEVLWIITNIAAGQTHHTQAIVDSNLIPGIVQLLSSPFQLVRLQVIM